jgi:hypothetical protein
MLRKLFFPLVLIFFSFHGILLADGGKAGYAGAFLELSLFARSAGMGGAFVGLADDASATLSNPAGSFQVRKKTFLATHRKMDLDRKLNWVGYLHPIKDEASITLSWINVGVGELYERDDRGDLGQEISDYQNAVTFNFSRQMIEKLLYMGLNIKYIQHNLANISAYGVGFDFGAMVHPVPKLRLGLAVQNVGMQYSWASGDYWKKFNELGTSSKDEFPVNFKLGASWAEFENKLLASIEVEKDNQQDVKFKMGAEYKIIELLAGRIGYNDGSFAFGLGLEQDLKNLIFGLDYAYVKSDVGLDPDHVVSIKCSF